MYILFLLKYSKTTYFLRRVATLATILPNNLKKKYTEPTPFWIDELYCFLKTTVRGF